MSEVYDFPVVRVPAIAMVEGIEVKTDKDVIVRSDTNIALGIVGKSYHLVTHNEAVEKAQKALSSLGGWRMTKASIAGQGAKAFMEFTDESHPITIIEKDDILPKLILQNSYDGTQEIGFSLGAYRLICSNGLRIGTTIFSIHKKHTDGLDIDAIVERAREAYDNFTQVVVPEFEEMGLRTIDNVQRELDTLREMKRLPKRMIDKVSEKITKDIMTAWELYNEFTAYLTHEYDKSDIRREELGALVTSVFVGR